MNERNYREWAWGIVGAFACASGSAMAGDARIWPTATVTGESVQLGDIAELRGFDVVSTDRLSQIAVFNAPTVGGEVLVRADDIRSALADAGEDLSSISLMGAAGCKVSKPRPPREPRVPPVQSKPARKTVKPHEARPQHSAPEPLAPSTPRPGTLESAIRDYILASFPQRDAKLEIRFSPAKAEDLKITGHGVTFDVRARDEKKLGLRTFEAVVRQAGKDDRVIPVVGEVTLINEVVVAKRAINRGETIEGRALKLEERRFTDMAGVGLTDLSAAVGQQSRGFLRPGEMITAESLEQRPVVVRGQPVTIWMRQGTLAIRTMGKAQASGALGDRIDVLRDGAKRKQDLIEAIVTGPGTVSMGTADQVALR